MIFLENICDKILPIFGQKHLFFGFFSFFERTAIYFFLIFHKCCADLYTDPLQMRIARLMQQRKNMMMQKRVAPFSKRNGHEEAVVYNRRLKPLKQAVRFVHSERNFFDGNGRERSVKFHPTEKLEMSRDDDNFSSFCFVCFFLVFLVFMVLI